MEGGEDRKLIFKLISAKLCTTLKPNENHEMKEAETVTERRSIRILLNDLPLTSVRRKTERDYR